jgi:AAA domain
MTKTNAEFLSNIPPELRTPALWLQYYEVRDPKKPDKKPGKHPCVKYATPEHRKANLRPLDELLKRPKQAGFQRYVDKAEGFVYVDLDKVRNVESGEVEPWASELIEEIDSYTEVSASGKGFHIVCRGKLDEDFHVDPNQVEIYSGNIPNKLMAMTGDVVDLHLTIEDRQGKAEQLLRRMKGTPITAPLDWRKRFHTVDELPDGDIRFLIENVLPEGVAFIGALSGVGKTWFCLSMARALTTGKKFLGNWDVPEPVEVLYLCPEMNGKTFKKRCRLFGISERFHCMTISDGVPLNLKDSALVAAVDELKPVIFLDTAIRFMHIEDENSSSQFAQGLAEAVFALVHMGAQAVVCLHHRAKAGAEADELTLENTLRGSGDIGAICDVVWGLQYEKGSGGQYAKESRKLVRLQVSCVKARDFTSPEDLRIQLSPFIEQIGDFAVLDGDPETTANEGRKSETEKLNAAISAKPAASIRKLESTTGIGRNRIKKVAAEAGWQFSDNSWLRNEEGMSF